MVKGEIFFVSLQKYITITNNYYHEKEASAFGLGIVCYTIVIRSD